jgi:beta-lactamase regulating signal transducer with metallopeptidase domain/protocatechuate 3,4-dioxygenase beta subunit
MARWLIDSIASGGLPVALSDAVAKGTILLCLTTAIAAILRRSGAAVRHRVWALALCGMIAMPFLSWSFPGWRMSILPSGWGLPGSRASWSHGAAESGSNRARNESRSGRSELDHGGSGPAQAQQSGNRDDRVAAISRSSSVSQSLSPAGMALRESDWIALLWALGFISVAWPALLGIAGNEWRRRHSRLIVDQTWLELIENLTRQFGLRRPIELRSSPVPLVPVTWGVLRPVILVPEQAQQWPESARRVVLLHELAHVKRWDVAFQLIGRLATAVYWFHPLAWYALHRLRAECECACDDYVVDLGVRRTDYAQQLVYLARSLRAAALTAAVPLTRKNTLEQRLKALLDDGRSHQLLGKRGAMALFTGAVVLLAGLAAVRPGASKAVQPGIVSPSAPTANLNKAQDGRESLKSTAVVQAPPLPKAPSPDESLPGTYTYPITVTGRAVDQRGQPIPGARVYLASRRANYKRIAETTTDAEGRYDFNDVPLPIERSTTVSGRDEGVFQVFGQVEGFGFAWRPEKWFFPRPKPANITHEPVLRDPPGQYEAEEKIVLDLRFPPSAKLSGTIVDDLGKPLSNARLEIRDCVSLRVVDDVRPGWQLDCLNERESAPASMKIRNSDAQGRFEFTGLPSDCQFWIHLRAQNFAWQSFYAATTDLPQPDHDGMPVLTDGMRIVVAKPVDIPIRVVYGDTGEPAPKVAVSAAKGLVSTLETTDDQGRATLRLPPGKYRMQNLPARGTSYLVTDGELIVKAMPAPEPVVAKLRPAVIIDLTVVDVETGVGIPDVDVWQAGPAGHRERVYFRSWEVATRIAWVERPRTDASGKLRALIEPGKHRIGVGLESFPRGYAPVETDAQEVECLPGETVQVIFTMRKRH